MGEILRKILKMVDKSEVESQDERNSKKELVDEIGFVGGGLSRGLVGWAMPLIASAQFSVGSLEKAAASQESSPDQPLYSQEEGGWYVPEDSVTDEGVRDTPVITGVVSHTETEPLTGMDITYYGNTAPEWEESLVETWQTQSSDEINQFLEDGGIQLVGAENPGKVFEIEFFPGSIYDSRFTNLQYPALYWNKTIFVSEYCYTDSNLGLTESQLNTTDAIAQAAEDLPGLLDANPNYGNETNWIPDTRTALSSYVDHEKGHGLYALAGIDNDSSFRNSYALDVHDNGGRQACIEKGFGYWIQEDPARGRSEAFADAYSAINNPWRDLSVAEQDILEYFPHTATWVYKYQRGFARYQPAFDSPDFSTELDRGIVTTRLTNFSKLQDGDPAEGLEIVPGLEGQAGTPGGSSLDSISDTDHSWFGARVCCVPEAPHSGHAAFASFDLAEALHLDIHPQLSPNLKVVCVAASMGLIWMKKSDENFTGLTNLDYLESRMPKPVRDAFAPAAKAVGRGVGKIVSLLDQNVDDAYCASKAAIRSSLNKARNKVRVLVR
jgi:hypothetical protein